MIDPAARPVKVDRPSDVTGLVDTGRLVQLLPPADAAVVMQAVEQISEAKLQHMTEDAIVEQLIRCGFVESTQLVATFGDPALLDPLADTDITGDRHLQRRRAQPGQVPEDRVGDEARA